MADALSKLLRVKVELEALKLATNSPMTTTMSGKVSETLATHEKIQILKMKHAYQQNCLEQKKQALQEELEQVQDCILVEKYQQILKLETTLDKATYQIV